MKSIIYGGLQLPTVKYIYSLEIHSSMCGLPNVSECLRLIPVYSVAKGNQFDFTDLQKSVHYNNIL